MASLKSAEEFTCNPIFVGCRDWTFDYYAGIWGPPGRGGAVLTKSEGVDLERRNKPA